MDNQDTINAFYGLADRWLELSAEAAERASKAKKGSPFALYETITSEVLNACSQELGTTLDQLEEGSLDELVTQIKMLLTSWFIRSEDAKEKSAKTSLDGARHVGTALGLDMVIDQLKKVMEAQHISIS
jgi:hypothetical protein